MTAYLSDFVTVDELASSDTGSRTQAAGSISRDLLQAFGQLLNAKSVDLVHFQLKARSTKLIAEWSRDNQPVHLRATALTTAVLEEARLTRPRSRSADNDQVSIFATEIGQREGGTIYLVIHFDRHAQRADLIPLMLGLVANLRYAFSLETRILEVEARAEIAMAALDQDKCGIIAVAPDGQVAFMNGAAAAALSRGDIVQLSHNMVRPTHYTDAIRFLAALDSVASRQSGKRRDAMIMRLNGNGLAAPMIVSIAPFGDDAPVMPKKHPAAIIHMLQLAAGDDGLNAVCQLFCLSPIEVQLARHLFHGQTLAAAAEAMHIKGETARSYLKQIFAKTDTHRQADLVGLFFRYSLVVRNTYEYIAV